MFKSKNLQVDLKEQIDLSALTDEELREKYLAIKKQEDLKVTAEVFSIISETIKRIYGYSIVDKDIQILNKFLAKRTLNINNYNDIFYPFLIYLVLMDFYKSKICVLYINRFLLHEHISETKKIFNFLDVQCASNISSDKCEKLEVRFKSKAEIFASNVIFSSYEELLFDYINDLSNKNKQNMKEIYQNLFVFDIDRILGDFEKCNFKVIGTVLKENYIKIKPFFKKFKTIQGVSQGLIFEKNSFARSYKLKIDKSEKRKEVLEYLKKPNDNFYYNFDKKIIGILRKIEEFIKEDYSIVVCIENTYELQILEEYLRIKKINFATINNDTLSQAKDLIKILKNGKVTLISNFLAPFVKPEGINKEDMNYEINMSAYAYNLDIEEEKEEDIKAKIIFASHYTEFKNEYLVINNYFDKISSNDDILFFNCPTDEIFRLFYLDKINLIEKENSKDTEKKYKIISKFIYFLRKFHLSKIKKEKSCLIYHYDDSVKEACHILKINDDDYCYCSSGLKFKNCCGKDIK